MARKRFPRSRGFFCVVGGDEKEMMTRVMALRALHGSSALQSGSAATTNLSSFPHSSPPLLFPRYFLSMLPPIRAHPSSVSASAAAETNVIASH